MLRSPVRNWAFCHLYAGPNPAKAGAGERKGYLGGKWEAVGKDWTTAFGSNAGLAWLQCCVVQYLGSTLCGNLSHTNSWSHPLLVLNCFVPIYPEKRLIICWFGSLKGLWVAICVQGGKDNQRSQMSVWCCAAYFMVLISLLFWFFFFPNI